MQTLDKNKLAYCGLYCDLCSFKVAHDAQDHKHLDAVPYQFKRMSLPDYNCEGCKGYCICGPCAIKDCAQEKAIDSCADCKDFPCTHVETFAGDGIPHHAGAVENLRAIHKQGLDAWFVELEPTLACHCGERHSWYYTCEEHKEQSRIPGENT